MKKILIRGRTPLFNNPGYEEFIHKDLPWASIGHLLFSNSTMKTTMTSVEDEFINIYPGLISKNLDNEKFIDKINAECKYFLINFSVLFAKNSTNMKMYLPFIKKLKIPCIVIGCSFEGEVDPKFKEEKYSFDDLAREFCEAILEKSASIGVRGEITYDYLTKHLGLPKECVDITGCPSLYFWGEQLPQFKSREFDDEDFTMSFSFNYHTSYSAQKNVCDFFNNYVSTMTNKNYYYIPQQTCELRLMYWGHSDKKFNKIPNFPSDFSHRFYQDKRVISFIDIYSWFNFLKENVDFAFGSRIHGTIAPILSGVPAMVIKVDSRVRELSEKHGIPSISVSDLERHPDLSEVERVRLFYETADFSKVHTKHKENFAEWLAFLRKNEIENIYDNQNTMPLPYDVRRRSVEVAPPLIPLNAVSSGELSARLNSYYEFLEKKKQAGLKNKQQLIAKQIQSVLRKF